MQPWWCREQAEAISGEGKAPLFSALPLPSCALPQCQGIALQEQNGKTSLRASNDIHAQFLQTSVRGQGGNRKILFANFYGSKGTKSHLPAAFCFGLQLSWKQGALHGSPQAQSRSDWKASCQMMGSDWVTRTMRSLRTCHTPALGTSLGHMEKQSKVKAVARAMESVYSCPEFEAIPRSRASFVMARAGQCHWRLVGNHMQMGVC